MCVALIQHIPPRPCESHNDHELASHERHVVRTLEQDDRASEFMRVPGGFRLTHSKNAKASLQIIRPDPSSSHNRTVTTGLGQGTSTAGPSVHDLARFGFMLGSYIALITVLVIKRVIANIIFKGCRDSATFELN